MADPLTPTIDSSQGAPATWDEIRASLAAVPEVASSPSLAASVIQATPASVSWSDTGAPDALGTAQAAAGAANLAAGDDVVKAHKAHGVNLFGELFTSVSHAVSGVWNEVPGHQLANNVASAVASPISTPSNLAKEGLSTAAHWANWPLQQVQHTYRYYHDVVAHHGVTAGLGALLKNSIASGFNPAGALLTPALQRGVDVATGNTDMDFADSWARSQNAVVSPGRDLAGLFQLKPGNGFQGQLYSAISGTGDAAFDLATDPTIVMGKIGQALKLSARAVAGVDDVIKAANAAKGVKGAINPLYAGTGRAIRDMAEDKSSASLAAKYPMLQGVGGGVDPLTGKPAQSMLDHIAKAKTYDDVVDVLKAHAIAHEFVGAKIMPTMSLTRIPFRKVNEMFKSWELPTTGAAASLDIPTVGPLTEAQDALKTAIGPTRDQASKLQKAKDSVAKAVKTFTADTPFARDNGNLVGAGERISPLNPSAPRVLYQILKYGQSDLAAKLIAQKFAEATTVGEKATIWHNSILQTFHAAGVPADPNFGRKLLADLDGAADVAATSSGHEFMVDEKGMLHPGFLAPNGERVKGAIASTQVGNFYIPKYMDDFVSPARQAGARATGESIVDAAKRGRAYLALYGKMDDWYYEHVTKGFFKKNVLFTGGFAWRNALTEDMTAAIGDGGMGVITNGIQAAAAKLKYKLAGPEEIKQIVATLADSADKSTWQKFVDDPLHLRQHLEFMLEHDGHLTSSDVSTHHFSASGTGGDLTSEMANNVKRKLHPGIWGARFDRNSYVKYGTSDGIERLSNALASHMRTMTREGGIRKQADAYRTHLEIARRDKGLTESQVQDRAMAQAIRVGHGWLTRTPAGKAAVERMIGAGMPTLEGADPLWDLARVRAHAIRGMTTDANGNVIPELLDGIADSSRHLDWNKQIPGVDDTRFQIHPNLRPSAIKAMGIDRLPQAAVGMEIVPTAGAQTIGRIVDQGFAKVLSPAIQYMSRNGIFHNYLKQELAIARRVPGLTEEEAKHMAETRAAERMIPKIHNPRDRALFGELVRNYIPFYFARQQSFRRLGTALAENPLGFRQLQLAYHGMKDTGFVSTDPTTGEDQFSYPLSGELGRVLPVALDKLGIHAAIGIPSGFRGSITGLAPGGDVPGGATTSAGFSPLVTIGTKAISQVFPEFKPTAEKLTGPLAQEQPLWSILAPNSAVRNAITAYAGDHSRAFQGAMVDAMQWAYAHGNVPPENSQPGDPGWQKWIDQIRSQTRMMLTLRALYGIGSPTSPILVQGDGAPKGFNISNSDKPTLTDQFQSYITKYGLSGGTKQFLLKYPNATSYTIFKTEGAGGVNIPETHLALDWAKANKSFIEKNGEVGSFFVPQAPIADPDALSVWKQQMASGLRHQKSPDEFAQQMIVQDGWNRYEADHDVFLAATKNMDPNSDQYKAEKQHFDQYVQDSLAPSAPLWYADYNSSDVRKGQKHEMVKQLQSLYDSGKVPDSPMAGPIKGLLDDYALYQQAYDDPNPNAPSKSAQRDHWNEYLATVVQDQPQLASIVNRVFKGL